MEYIVVEKALLHYTRLADLFWNKLIFKTDKYRYVGLLNFRKLEFFNRLYHLL